MVQVTGRDTRLLIESEDNRVWVRDLGVFSGAPLRGTPHR